MPLYVHNGALLVRDGALAAAESCCCGGAGGVCCGPACTGSAWGVDFAPSEGMGAAFSAFLQGRGYTNITTTMTGSSAGWNGQCCKFDFDDTVSFTVTGSDGFSEFTHYVSKCLAAPAEGTNCVEGLTQAECLALYGTPNAAATCTPDPCGCPDGCPSLDGCNLVVVLNYPGNPVEAINLNAADYVAGAYANCQLAFSIADINIESGGDIDGTATVSYDELCNPVISGIVVTRAVDSPDNEQSCDDGITDCVEVLVSLDCNPLP